MRLLPDAVTARPICHNLWSQKRWPLLMRYFDSMGSTYLPHVTHYYEAYVHTSEGSPNAVQSTGFRWVNWTTRHCAGKRYSLTRHTTQWNPRWTNMNRAVNSNQEKADHHRRNEWSTWFGLGNLHRCKSHHLFVLVIRLGCVSVVSKPTTRCANLAPVCYNERIDNGCAS